MLIFHCTDCNKEIDYLDQESPDQAFTNLDEHIAKCPVATFTIEATTEWAKDIAEVMQSAIQHDQLKGKITATLMTIRNGPPSRFLPSVANLLAVGITVEEII